MKLFSLFLILVLVTGCSTQKIDYRQPSISQPHIIEVTLPNFLVTDSSYTYKIFTQPYTKEIQFFWYYGKIGKENLIQMSTVHPLNEKPVKSPYDIKWGVESDFQVGISGEWYLVVLTSDIYGNTKVYNRRYRVIRM